ncbi:hypothetical protein BLNAU_14170 [Blattamonas nauphoetae]|uniref:Uncharacterized protein n=1 Tax=Blattamonas nauphoetae TaxID=2049346 RepID=A0ABQ9XHS7_9EUKA|nr:hypothetical protein BLNAU_14170 [Blattamonas nauphoetae]
MFVQRRTPNTLLGFLDGKSPSIAVFSLKFQIKCLCSSSSKNHKTSARPHHQTLSFISCIIIIKRFWKMQTTFSLTCVIEPSPTVNPPQTLINPSVFDMEYVITRIQSYLPEGDSPLLYSSVLVPSANVMVCGEGQLSEYVVGIFDLRPDRGANLMTFHVPLKQTPFVSLLDVIPGPSRGIEGGSNDQDELYPDIRKADRTEFTQLPESITEAISECKIPNPAPLDASIRFTVRNTSYTTCSFVTKIQSSLFLFLYVQQNGRRFHSTIFIKSIWTSDMKFSLQVCLLYQLTLYFFSGLSNSVPLCYSHNHISRITVRVDRSSTIPPLQWNSERRDAPERYPHP